MVRKLTTTPRTRAWKALLATVVISGGLLWHILACLESPMAFSPDGKQLAFVTMEPSGADKDLAIAGAHCYRLMVLRDFKKIEVIEQTTDHMLTAPAWSPDGKRICYLRIPLMTREELKKFKKTIKKRSKAFDRIGTLGQVSWPTSRPASSPATKPGPQLVSKTEDRLLPSLHMSQSLYKSVISRPWPPTQVVVRDGRTFEIVSTKTVQLPLGIGDDEVGNDLMMAYGLTNPQYGPNGKWVYLCAGGMAIALDPTSGERRFLAAPAMVGSLSPDGKTLATLGGKAIAFIRTDGNLAVYRRLTELLSLQLFWKDNQTVAALAAREDGDPEVWFVRRDGTNAGSIALKVPDDRDKDSLLGLAFARDGKHIVLCYSNGALFLDAAGKILKQVRTKDKQFLFKPVFAPDSRHVAMKLVVEEDHGKGRVKEIVVFTPEGKEVARVKVPKIKPGTLPKGKE